MDTDPKVLRRHKAKCIGLWLGVAASALAAIWCCNLVIFHLWASDVPPYATEWHLWWAGYSGIALMAFVAVGIVCTRGLFSGRGKSA